MQAQDQSIDRALADLEHAFPGMVVVGVPVQGVGESSDEDEGLVGEEFLLRDRFRCPRRRREFVAGRLAARRAIGRLQCLPGPASMPILKDESGAPVIVGGAPIHISISHANEYAVAIAAHVDVGIDVEVDEARPASFPKLFFSPGEQRRLATTPAVEQRTLLNMLWTRKEAVSKVGRWGGRLAFASVDCLEDVVHIEGKAIRVQSIQRGGYLLSVAVENMECFAHG